MTVTGDLCADLLSHIASEQRAKVVYEYLFRQIHDKKVRETIDFLLNWEEAHNAMFWEALIRYRIPVLTVILKRQRRQKCTLVCQIRLPNQISGI